VLVVGGGPAGVSAAVELAERGVPVTLVERSGRLGGKVSGWRTAEGVSLEHGLHGIWPEYVNFRDLLTRAGIADIAAEAIDRLDILHADGRLDTLRPLGLPAPFGALGLLRGVKSLPLRALVNSVRAFVAIAAFDPDDLRWLDDMDMHTWARRTGMPPQAIATLLETTIRANLFLPLERTSAWSGVNALHRGLRSHDGWRYAWMRGNPGAHIWEPLGEHLAARGVEIRLASDVRAVMLVDGRVTGAALADGSRIHAEQVVLAVDVESCKAILNASELAGDAWFNRLLNLVATDVLVTRTRFEGTVRLARRQLGLAGFRTVDFVADVSSFQSEVQRDGALLIETQSYLGRPLMDAPDAVLRQLVLRDVMTAMPELVDARPVETVLARHRGLFTAFTVGFESNRPGTATSVPNLHLAGDWVRGAEGAMFMENAVISGRRAAAGALGAPVAVLPLPASDGPVRALQALARPLRRARRSWRRVSGFHPIGQGEERR
jgi:uncharacterized protein with NAD-binding domain and iron-sulfur cluster